MGIVNRTGLVSGPALYFCSDVFMLSLQVIISPSLSGLSIACELLVRSIIVTEAAMVIWGSRFA